MIKKRSVNPLDKEDKYYCQICNLNVPDIILHESGDFHKSELLEYHASTSEGEVEVEVEEEGEGEGEEEGEEEGD